jgi:hypothetical protein
MNALSNRFFLAITLCTGDGAIKPRLSQAWIEQLDEISPDELPSSLAKDFLHLRKAMYAEIPLANEHAAQASIRKMSVKQAVEHTRIITVMFRELASANETDMDMNMDIKYESESGSKTEIHYDQDNSQHLN